MNLDNQHGTSTPVPQNTNTQPPPDPQAHPAQPQYASLPPQYPAPPQFTASPPAQYSAPPNAITPKNYAKMALISALLCLACNSLAFTLLYVFLLPMRQLGSVYSLFVFIKEIASIIWATISLVLAIIALKKKPSFAAGFAAGISGNMIFLIFWSFFINALTTLL